MTEPIVELDHVSVQFGSHLVHRDISLRVFPGEVLTILGPSGSGKTLILKLIIGLLQPTTGRVCVLGHCLAGLSEVELLSVREKIGMLFQGAALFDSLSVYENIAYSLRERGHHSELEMQRIVEEKLDLIGLPGIQHKFPAQLSGGQKKRVGLARALASSPQVVLFDEPTTGLDPTATRMIDDLIQKLKNDFGITSVIVTHDIASARRISDRWALIHDGTVVADGPAHRLATESALVQAFVEGNWRE